MKPPPKTIIKIFTFLKEFLEKIQKLTTRGNAFTRSPLRGPNKTESKLGSAWEAGRPSQRPLYVFQFLMENKSSYNTAPWKILGNLKTRRGMVLGVCHFRVRVGDPPVLDKTHFDDLINWDFMRPLGDSCLCGSVAKDFGYHACGREFESRLKWKFSNSPHHLWLLLSDYIGMAKWFGAHYNKEEQLIVRKCNFVFDYAATLGPGVLSYTKLLNLSRPPDCSGLQTT